MIFVRRILSRKKSIVFFLGGLLSLISVFPQNNELVINAKKVEFPVPKALFGLNVSDINFAFDGGLYAELIQNRSFDYDFPWLSWTPLGNVKIENAKPYFDQNPRYVRFAFAGEAMGCSIENGGFDGITLKSGDSYQFSCYARTSGNCAHKLKVELLTADNDVISSKILDLTGKNWVKYVTFLSSTCSTTTAKLRLTSLMRGVVDVDQVSLFPEKTFLEESNGLREDLAQAILDIKPNFLRFPGGNVIDRKNRVTHFDWKKTIGKVGNRPSSLSYLSYILPERKFPNYYQSNGLGLYEFLNFCENSEATPILVVDCGLSALRDARNGKKFVQSEWLDENCEQVLDLIEFVNGDENSKWGNKRLSMGHPDPYNVKILSIADNPKNEEEFRYLSAFVARIKQRYPKLDIFGSAGVNPDAKELDNRREFLHNSGLYIVDEQLFRTPEWLFNHANRYDQYDRDNTRIAIGEFAAVSDNHKNSFASALAEAAFMTGVERNCDIVQSCCYATLLANIHAFQSAPNLIWFDKNSVVKTSSYYVQKLFSENRGTHIISVTYRNQPLTGQNGLYASSVIDRSKNRIILKIVNSTMESKSLSLVFDGHKNIRSKIEHMFLTADDIASENTIEKPNLITPQFEEIMLKNDPFEISLHPNSINVYSIDL